MIQPAERAVRCAIYTRKSTEEGLEQDFNSLDAQREAALAYINSQKHAGWVSLEPSYDDGGYTGGNTDRPAFQRMMQDVEDGKVDCIVVYKIDRLSRSLLDFVKIMEVLEENNISLVSVTQHFNTSTSMGRLILNILLSFAQFEREIISERTRDKIAAARRKGKWAGGHQVLGYDLKRKVGGNYLVINPREAELVRDIYQMYLESASIMDTLQKMREKRIRNKQYQTKNGNERGGREFNKSTLQRLLTNVTYLGKVKYKDQVYEGEHEAIVDEDLFGRVQGMLKRNRNTGGKYSRNRYSALLKGLVRCKHCGCAMSHHYVNKPNKRYRYYVCIKAQKQGWDTCPGPCLPAAELERFVVDRIKCVGQDSRILQESIRKAQSKCKDRIRELKQTRSDRHKQIRQLSKEIGQVSSQAGYSEDANRQLVSLQQQMNDVQTEITEINSQVVTIEKRMVNEDELVGAVEAFEPLWDSLSPKQKEKMVHLLVRQVEYDNEQETISITFHETDIETLNGKGDKHS